MTTEAEKSVQHRALASRELPDVVRTVGLIETFVACLNRCVESNEKSPEEAVVFAHEIFLTTARVWMNDKRK